MMKTPLHIPVAWHTQRRILAMLFAAPKAALHFLSHAAPKATPFTGQPAMTHAGSRIGSRLLPFALLLAVLLAGGCGSDSSEGSDPTPDPPTPPATDEIAFAGGATPAPVFSDEGGQQTIRFTASAAWTASVRNTRAEGWCSVSPASGAAGEAVVTVSAQPNTTPDERSAAVTIKAGTTERTVVVTQKQTDALTLTRSRFEVEASGGEIEVEVRANVDFECAVDPAAEWIVREGTRALETSVLRFRIAPNEVVERREGTIMLSGAGLTETVTVYQAGAAPSILLTQREYTVASAGGELRIEASSNVDVEVSVPDAAWIVENRTRALSTHTFYFTVAENDTYV